MASHDVFPFFELPPEVRNNIYGRVHQHVKLPFKWDNDDGDASNGGLFYPEIYHFCRQNMRLVSKQFKKEYQAEIFTNASLSCIMVLLSDPQTHPLSLESNWFTKYYLRRIRRVSFQCSNPHLDEDTCNCIHPMACILILTRGSFRNDWNFEHTDERRVVSDPILTAL